MIPEPSKRPFRFPLPESALPYFCHPDHVPFTAPVRLESGEMGAASGWVALRVRRFHGFAEEYPPASAEFVERFEALPWAKWPDLTGREWRKFDAVAGTLWRDPPLSLWRMESMKWRISRQKLVRVAGAPLVPLALLQLLSRLPAAELCLHAPEPTSPVFFRFAGDGMGIIPHHGHLEGGAFELFKPKQAATRDFR
jgi:hypothetical protein